MLFETLGDRKNPAVLFFHAMGVTGESSKPVADFLKDRYFCILPTSTVYCAGQKYISKDDEVRQIKAFLEKNQIKRLKLIVASSIGADLAMAFISDFEIPAEQVFFDGGQFARIGAFTRRIMTPFLYLAIKSVYRSKGKTLGKIMWCDNDSIKPYFIDAGKALRYTNLRRQMSDSLKNEPFLKLSDDMQKRTYFEYGSIEDHYKYRDALILAYPHGNFPVFEGYNHMQYQIKDPKGFAAMLESIAEKGTLPPLPQLKP